MKVHLGRICRAVYLQDEAKLLGLEITGKRVSPENIHKRRGAEKADDERLDNLHILVSVDKSGSRPQ